MGGWIIECVRGYKCLTCFDVFRTFVFWTHGAFTSLSRRWGAAYELDTHLILLYVICCTAVIHSRCVNRLVGVTAVLRTAVLL